MFNGGSLRQHELCFWLSPGSLLRMSGFCGTELDRRSGASHVLPGPPDFSTDFCCCRFLFYSTMSNTWKYLDEIPVDPRLTARKRFALRVGSDVTVTFK